MDIQKDERREFDGLMVYFWQNIWKQRNRRIFQYSVTQPLQLAYIIKEDVQQYKLAGFQARCANLTLETPAALGFRWQQFSSVGDCLTHPYVTSSIFLSFFWFSFLVLARVQFQNKFQKTSTVVIISNLTIRAWSIKCRRKKNQLHSLVENHETNVLSLITP